jgi:4-amino-4-deoxychorismate lyase
MHDEALIDGVAASSDCLSERAFQFGDGLFETLAVVDGTPCLWNLHSERLALGCRRLRLPLPDFDLLHAESRAICAGRARAVLKLYWTAGRSARGYARPPTMQPRRMLRVYDWAGDDAGTAWTVVQCQHRLSDNPALAQIKHLNRLDQVIARGEWDDPAIAEGIMLGQDGRVVCGTMSNLFLQFGDTLRTPSVERAGVAGVVRRLALQLAARDGHQVREAFILPNDLHEADAVFLTNSLVGVARIGRFLSTDYDTTLAEHTLMTETRHHCHWPGGGCAV